MDSERRTVDAVFLNVPYDAGYESKFVALIATTVAAGLAPRCALELPERGEGQLERIIQIIQACRLSIHDLSRVGGPARFNMPFELGMVVALRLLDRNRRHQFILLESTRGRLAHTLTDLGDVNPLIHGNSPLRLIACVLDNLRGRVAPGRVEKIYRRLMAVLGELKREYRSESVFVRSIFEELVVGAISAARDERLLR